MGGQSNIFNKPDNQDPFGNPSYATDGTFSTEKRNYAKMDQMKKKAQLDWESSINAGHNKLR